jgi:hypothetical protein
MTTTSDAAERLAVQTALESADRLSRLSLRTSLCNGPGAEAWYHALGRLSPRAHLASLTLIGYSSSQGQPVDKLLYSLQAMMARVCTPALVAFSADSLILAPGGEAKQWMAPLVRATGMRHLTVDTRDVAFLRAALPHMTQLRHLSCAVAGGAWCAIPSWVRSVEVRDYLDAASLERLLGGLARHVSVHMRPDSDDAAWPTLFRALQAPQGRLRSLCLTGGTEVTEDAWLTVAALVVNVVRLSTRLHVLEIQDFQLREADVRSLCDALDTRMRATTRPLALSICGHQLDKSGTLLLSHTLHRWHAARPGSLSIDISPVPMDSEDDEYFSPEAWARLFPSPMRLKLDAAAQSFPDAAHRPGPM